MTGSVSTQSAFPWRTVLPAWLLGLVFVGSAVAKMLALGPFEVYLVQQHLAPSREYAAVAARGLLALELFLGLACFARSGFRRFTLPAIMAMLAAFSLYLAYLAFVRKDTGSCHCFGELLPMSPLHSLCKNLALLALAGWLRRGTREWPAGSPAVPAVLAAASALIVFLGFPARPVAVEPDAAGTAAGPSRFAVFHSLSDGRPAGLTTGTCLAVFVSLDCEHCRALVTRLAEVGRQQPLPPVRLICLGEAKDTPAFLAGTGADFPWLCAAPETFFGFIGERPPRLYLLQDGRPRAFWDTETFSPEQIRRWWPSAGVLGR